MFLELAYLGLFARLIGLTLLVIAVLPVMVYELRHGKDYKLIRLALPIIIVSYILTILPGIFVVTCRINGCDYYDEGTVNLASMIGGFNVLLGTLGWLFIYRKG